MKTSVYTVTTPSEKNSEVSRSEHEIITKALESFEGQLKSAKLVDNCYNLKYLGVNQIEIDDNICSKIEEIYKGAGWKTVSCKTSSRQGGYNETDYETILTLSMQELTKEPQRLTLEIFNENQNVINSSEVIIYCPYRSDVQTLRSDMLKLGYKYVGAEPVGNGFMHFDYHFSKL